MPLSLELIAPAELRRSLSARLVGVETPDDATLDCEFIRRAVWALTAEGVEAHVSRALNVVLEAAAPLYEGAEQNLLRRRFRNAMDELGQVGDLVELPGGYWHPAVVREISLETRGDVLLVGGLPTSVLPQQLRATVTSRRAFRWVRPGLAAGALGAETETLGTWVGRPSASLIDWSQELLSSDIPQTDDAPEVRYYVPKGKPRALSQRHRWQDQAPQEGGRFLVVFTGLFGVRQYRIAEVRGGRVWRLGGVLLPGEPRRLMYAIDSLANTSVAVELFQEGPDSVLLLWSELPGPELRLLGALGTLQTPTDRYYPRRWRFPREREVVVRAALEELHVLVPNGQQGRGT